MKLLRNCVKIAPEVFGTKLPMSYARIASEVSVLTFNRAKTAAEESGARLHMKLPMSCV